MDILISGFCFVILLVGALILIFWRPSRKRIPPERVQYFQSEIHACNKLSPMERIIRYDAILHSILQDYGYEGSVGDQLKAKPPMITNLDVIWDFHKLRNHLAHEIKPISQQVLETKSRLFEQALLWLLKK